ncbi:hypothetical protein [Acanthopleuribacter pedis]|uniref:HNH endonuclease n=1 Tax=Acanthopleuribacter pedis TaxID=442870 RepID=A0A8J7U4Q3_9BACT|nr:hypothetical protein [Acanthopleuribacter pedis]MBO1320882.1 hypothetical protein [Acanthopleuribacter pedis]
MNKLHRLSLSKHTQNVLSGRHTKVVDSSMTLTYTDRSGGEVELTETDEKAERLWRNRGRTKADQEILKRLKFSAGGNWSYCESNELSQVDHFYPRSRYSERCFLWDNYVGACGPCNAAKGDAFPLDSGTPLLLNPYIEDALDYFFFSPKTGKLVIRRDISRHDQERARLTLGTLELNRREKARKIHFRTCVAAIKEYAKAKLAGDSGKMADLRESMLERNHSVLSFLLLLWRRNMLDWDLSDALARAGEIADWVKVVRDDEALLRELLFKVLDQVAVELGELCLTFEDGSLLYLCRFSRRIALADTASKLSESRLVDFEVLDRELILVFDRCRVTLDRSADQCMFFVQDDRLLGVW